MNEIIKKLVTVLLSKDALIDNCTASFTLNLKSIINDYKPTILFNERSADSIFEALENEIADSFNLTIKVDKAGDYRLGWHQTKYVFYSGDGNKMCNSLYECLSNISGFNMDNYNRSVKNIEIPSDKLSEHIDLLIQFDDMLNEHRQSILEHINKINSLNS